ncbi:MAG TPA: glycoside hydrolase family 2 TIM barrel-domain containing protein [bacterium]|nr:glycoside hydrolase family 2 TIM barrel-domain containing protein [bacterium]HPN46124.1 glycoside hydrolase family 2 TIM barrel-domain containing protein [bacterium]
MKAHIILSALRTLAIIGCVYTLTLSAQPFDGQNIPLPEHPRPDFMRSAWLNLNGPWDFRFDGANVGLTEQWFSGNVKFNKSIMAPFPWGSNLSGVKDEADIAWYGRDITIPAAWQESRIVLVIGACDWHTTAWLDGALLGEHRGGYTPFEFTFPADLDRSVSHRLVLRVDDTPHPFKLEGKQGYGRAAGIWQTVYLEARPSIAVQTIHLTPDIDHNKVNVKVVLNTPAAKNLQLTLEIKGSATPSFLTEKKISKGKQDVQFDVSIDNPRLWSLDDPYLYDVTATLTGNGETDRVDTYFGMRKISVGNMPGTDIPYILLNNKPVYLQLTLDQSYHPDGFYTFPSDEFMRDEILRTRRIGLNGQRIHVKVGIPRKLYWADKLGVLIMADVPNSWGEPGPEMRAEMEYAFRQMLQRDYNHPAIFSWILFNETWGLFTNRTYLPETQLWVADMFKLAKTLDASRLIEDNSPCNHDHVVTDMNTWHAYLPGYAWKEELDRIVKDTFPGSSWNFAPGYTQANQPNLNSECGNVWGYQGSTGDVDWSYDYHRMMNEFRRHPQICGWLYTEHHDVINEWNGYYRFDRSNKYTGLEEIVPGMTLNDLHGAFYISTGQDICRAVNPGAVVSVPLFASFMTDHYAGAELLLKTELAFCDNLGRQSVIPQQDIKILGAPWMNRELEPLAVTMPNTPGLAILRLVLQDAAGSALHHNFTSFVVGNSPSPRRETLSSGDDVFEVLRFAPASFTTAQWSVKEWNVLEGLKVNGAGSGYFEYKVKWPEQVKPASVQEAVFRAELGSKQLFGKDREDAGDMDGDYMRGQGAHDPSLNPNAYPMTDETVYPGAVEILVNGVSLGQFDLPDDPADHRGLLSWFSQPQDGKLREAGSYGTLISANIPAQALKAAAAAGELVIRLQVSEALPHGLAIYGERFGRYPVEPMVILKSS